MIAFTEQERAALQAAAAALKRNADRSEPIEAQHLKRVLGNLKKLLA